MKSLFLLGRQPLIGLAELESIFGAEKIIDSWDRYALLDIDHNSLSHTMLGSVIKIGLVEDEVAFSKLNDINDHLFKIISKKLVERGISNKFNVGISSYGCNKNSKDLTKISLSIKKLLKKDGFSIRIIPNKDEQLSTAQVIHNDLTNPHKGIEVFFVRKKDSVFICSTTSEQDIDSYTARDQARPFRDAFVGMLPPKLAQTIINLALGKSDRSNCTLLDPFCGTGVILQEAVLMGIPEIVGTDLEERMVEYSQGNIDWLEKRFDCSSQSITITKGDATTARWENIKTVATETYLGQPLSTIPNKEKLRDIIDPVNLLHKKFLKNLHSQLKPGSRICIAIPAWKVRNDNFIHLPILDQLSVLGYNRVALEKVNSKDLLYFRPDQIVARELVILVRK
jgi:tRNA G10  N-methylase Trm11